MLEILFLILDKVRTNPDAATVELQPTSFVILLHFK